ncbi:MAG: hypothetical protein MRK02_16400 [Candidatus Scalindua sp.]|nr:hypothetical protein [Candidatus Scalindua sp.]
MMEKTSASITRNEENDALVDFLEKKILKQKQTAQDNLYSKIEPLKVTKEEKSENEENEKEWVKGLITEAIKKQKLWTESLINDIKKEQAEQEKKQKEWIQELIKGLKMSAQDEPTKLKKSVAKDTEREKKNIQVAKKGRRLK